MEAKPSIWSKMTIEQRNKAVEKGRKTRADNLAKKNALKASIEKEAVGIRYKIKELEDELAALEFKKTISSFDFGLDNKKLPYEEDIISNGYSVTDLGGVYFLIEDKEIVYVGQSINVYSRLQSHFTEKTFDKFTYIPLPRKYFDRVESFYIHTLRPKLNGSLGNRSGRLSAPMSLEEVVGFDSELFKMCKLREEKINNG